MLARAWCRFGRFDLSGVPGAKRRGALRLSVAGWAPYAEAASAVIWGTDGVASVWCWDAAKVRDATEPEVGGRRFARTLPESVLQSPLPDGLRLMRCLQGFEGQFWQASSLMASRWWPAPPSPDEWLAFQRGAGVPAADHVPVPDAQSEPLQQRPWSPVSAVDGADGEMAVWEPWLWTALLLALGVPAGTLGVREVLFHRQVMQAEQRLEQLHANASSRVMARENALAARDRLHAIADLQRYPAPLFLMEAISGTLPPGRMLLREWEQTQGSLRVQLATTGAPVAGTEQIAALEKTGLFDGVQVAAAADPKQIGFAMQVRPLRAAYSSSRRLAPAS